MVFLAFPITGAISLGVDTLIGSALLVETVFLAAIYLCIWSLNDPAPDTAVARPAFVACTVGILLVVVAMILTSHAAHATGGSHMVSYLVAPLALLSPQEVDTARCGRHPRAEWTGHRASYPAHLFPLLTVVLTAVTCMLARLSLDRDHLKDVQAKQDLALSQERERSRISADLHDILGQTLTGITVKADLAGRLLDAGRFEDARAQLDKVTEMSRLALSDVRQVVAANRTLLPDTEIESARKILAAAGIRMAVVRQGEPAPGTPATLVAHVIRGGCTNALKRSHPTRVVITLRDDGVKVENNGAPARGTPALLLRKAPGWPVCRKGYRDVAI